ncbi:uncharacterized protein LOC110095387 [Dendrobium catenatum]|uniref:DUF1664 domain-containing protein n=1 Tax=Dendrobium catenatum TaxID=906689 RepID=A0A2I0WD92_9ASPA|nr:uncharacterized protein LOC110095387 [Dendrobium catenatum]PKU73625.1 hypothetical protein MA16_Dca009932 [Dendrobium catenatum]
MAMHAGMGLSKVALLIGAGYTGSILVRNGKLSDILAELQTLLKSTEGSDSDSADSVAQQVSRLAMEIRQLASARSITVVNGGSGQGNVTSFLVPAATLGAVGYGYMWWKGLSFSDLMYVTKHSMANAVSSMTKHLEQVSNALAATKRHLTQRIEGLDGKLDEQKLMSKDIRDEVTQVRGKLENIGFDLSSIQQIVYSMDGKMNTIERKQAFLCAGIHHLCNTFPDKEGKLLEFLQEGPKLISNMRGCIGSAESANSKGLKHIVQALESGNLDNANLEGLLPNDTYSLEAGKGLSRTASINC